MKKGIEITRALAGYTRISYNGEEIAKHYLSATTQGTREAFEIPEEESVISWLENYFADEIKAIDEAQEQEENFIQKSNQITIKTKEMEAVKIIIQDTNKLIKRTLF